MTDQLSVVGKPLWDVNEYVQRTYDDVAGIFDSWIRTAWAQDGWPRSSRPSPAEVDKAKSLVEQYVAAMMPHSLIEKRFRWGVSSMEIRIWATDGLQAGNFNERNNVLSPLANYLMALDEDWSSRYRSEWRTGSVEFQFPECVRQVDIDEWLHQLREDVPSSVNDEVLREWAGRVLAGRLKFLLGDCRNIAELLIEDICEALLTRADYEPRQILCAATYFGGSGIYAVNGLIEGGFPRADLVAESIKKNKVLDSIVLMPSPLQISDLFVRAEQAAQAAVERGAKFDTAVTKTVTRTVTEQQYVTEYDEVKKLFGTKRVPKQVLRDVERQVQETVPTGEGTWQLKVPIPLQRTLRLRQYVGAAAEWIEDESIDEELLLSSSGEISSSLTSPFDPVATVERLQRRDLTWETYDEGSDSQLQAPWHGNLVKASEALEDLCAAMDAVG